MENRIWLKGDTHLHTCNSDGKLTPGQLVEACQQAGLDYAIITDHNYNTVKASYTDKNLLVMQGQEITDDLGHINVWGKKVPQDPPYILKTTEDYDAVLAPCREAGATISVNHPFCSMCGFHMDLEHFHFDCVEVWNTIQHSDNIKNMNWWHNQLLQGNHIAAVGGSDFHKDIGPLKLLANPTTIVHTTAKTEEAVLQALREGRSVVTNKPGTSMIYLTVGDANVGDTVSYAPGLTGKVAVTKFKKGHTIKVFNNNDVILNTPPHKTATGWNWILKFGSRALFGQKSTTPSARSCGLCTTRWRKNTSTRMWPICRHFSGRSPTPFGSADGGRAYYPLPAQKHRVVH